MDVVHMIHQSVDFLEGRTISATFTKLQAPRWLLHLSEVFINPCMSPPGYYSRAASTLSHPQMLTEPSEVTSKHGKNDRGGNVLLFLSPHMPGRITRHLLRTAGGDTQTQERALSARLQ